ncbi:phage tail sheath family protein [Dyella tabacisoli]|uniref:Phage tail sheath family protein n=1 Tax=Dyella tabacisoli TaxID=2282381 RepID=A0A369UQW2_9GAMM|nr:phage tail sheath C-terminal domain-containing protein [Dyella tabacisoli]RDD82128.1 phage tail sheath family protein [Dyella tabacisoli]
MQLTYPGVYIEEISSGVHSIIGVATSIAAFVGYTSSGPDHKAVELFNFADYQRNFGGLAADSELSYAVQQFFANGGTNAFVVRVPKDGSSAAQITIPDTADTETLLKFQALSNGKWAGNIAITIDYIGLTNADPDAFNLTVTNISTGVAEVFSNVTMKTTSANYVMAVVNDPDTGSAMVQVLPLVPGSLAQPARTGLISGSMSVAEQTAALTALQGAGAAGLTIKIDTDTAVAVTLYNATDPRPASLTEVYRMLSVKCARALQAGYPGAQVNVIPVQSSLTATHIDALSVVAQIPGKTDCTVSFGSPASGINVCTTLKLDTASLTSDNVAAYWMGGTSKVAPPYNITVTAASDGTALPTGTELIGDELLGTGIYALDKVDLFNILSLPDVTRAKPGAPSSPALNDSDINAVYAAAMDYCKKRRAFLLLDPPPDVVDVPSAINWRTHRLTVNDLNGAAYFPRVRIADPLNQNQLRSFAPCGVVAGVYATEDGNRGVWKAPAGIETVMSGVQKLTYNLSNDEQGVLNPIALNCLRSFPIYGSVIWGARTLVGADAQASEWKYVPVRRFALYLEESLYRGLQWAVFEPNADPLWAQIRMNVTSFMQNLFLQHAFQGLTPTQAYYVLCDSSTTTQANIDAGIVNIEVGFAPLKPAEFVVIQLQQMAGQVAV